MMCFASGFSMASKQNNFIPTSRITVISTAITSRVLTDDTQNTCIHTKFWVHLVLEGAHTVSSGHFYKDLKKIISYDRAI